MSETIANTAEVPVKRPKPKFIYNKNGLWLVNGDCFDLMDMMFEHNKKVEAIITSPPYNSNKKAGKHNTNQNVKTDYYHYIRYDIHIDNMTSEQYADWTVKLFEHYDKVLQTNGVVLYNLSFGSENPNDWVMALNGVVTRTNFTLADVLIWKKKTAFPISSSANKMTRITEFVFVLCRKPEIITFKSNKRITSVRDTGQKAYENMYNFIEARNNDGACELNKATFSSELVEKLIDMYVQPGSTVFDSFCGSGTTLVAVKNRGLKGIGCELSEAQCRWAVENRLEKNMEIVNAPKSKEAEDL